MLLLFIILNILPFKTGDIIFQDGSSNDFNNAIKNVTTNDTNYSFSHCGIIYKENDSTTFVIEATPPEGVVMTTIDNFIARSNNVVVARLDDSLQYIIPNAINDAKKLIGKEYDYNFDFENDKYYCSELIYWTYLYNNKEPIFSSNAMTFIDPNTNNMDSNWVKYFDKLNIQIPEGKEGCNPNGLFKSHFLKIVR